MATDAPWPTIVTLIFKLHVRDTTQPVRGYWSLVLEVSQNRSTTLVQAQQVQEWGQAS